MTLGFTLGLQFAYLLFAVSLTGVLLWIRQGRPELGRAVIRASVAGVCLFAVVTAFQARPFLRVAHDHPEAKRTTGIVAFFSPGAHGFLAAPPNSFLWAGPTAHTRNSLRTPEEMDLFPGITILVLAILGLASASYPAGIRLWVATGTLACGILSLGLPYVPEDPAHGYTKGFMPYRLFYDLAPGWDAGRTPGRLNTFTSLGLALLAGAGTALIVRVLRGRLTIRRSRLELAAGLTTAALAGLILLEGFGPIPHPRVPSVPSGQLGAAGPQLHLPSDDFRDGLYSYWSIGGFPKIVNGYGAFDPSILSQTRQVAATFPDRYSVAYLRDLGVRTVILHPDLAVGTPWQDAAARSTTGLPVIREDKDGVVLYHLG
jgi:hypothetical protein